MCLEWFDRLESPEFKNAKMSEITIFAQALVFFFATQDQVSTMTSAVIFHMTQDPELEKRVYQEIDAAFAKNNGKLQHEHLPELVFLNACISEALRLYAFSIAWNVFAQRTGKMKSLDWTENKKGMTIQIPIWAINRNPEYNEKPNDFIPDRFMPENKHKLNVYASTAFGHGPRICTGMRFAQEVMPQILVYLLRDLKFVARKNSQIKCIPGGPFMQPHEPIYVDVKKRSS